MFNVFYKEDTSRYLTYLLQTDLSRGPVRCTLHEHYPAITLLESLHETRIHALKVFVVFIYTGIHTWHTKYMQITFNYIDFHIITYISHTIRHVEATVFISGTMALSSTRLGFLHTTLKTHVGIGRGSQELQRWQHAVHRSWGRIDLAYTRLVYVSSNRAIQNRITSGKQKWITMENRWKSKILLK